MNEAKRLIERMEAEAEAERKRLQLFEKSNLCADFMPQDERDYLNALFDRRWAKRLEACPDYVKVAADTWTSVSTNWEYYPEWRRFFNRHREEVRRIWMKEEDYSVLRTFPKPFTLFRGYDKPLGKMGFSWTLDMQVAAKFSYRYGFNPWIITVAANPEDVIAYTDRRLEREVIIDPKKILTVLKEEPLDVKSFQEKARKGEPLAAHGVGAKSLKTSFSSRLALMQIVRFPDRSYAQITGGIFVAGERKPVAVEGRQVKIRCLEIREESVLIKIEGAKEVQELWLPDTAKRWKNYSG